MPWLNSNQKDLFWQILEPNPPTNRRGNLGLRFASFYSSELKNVTQIVEQLKAIEAGTFGAGKDEKTKQRYLNTLTNLGLVDVAGGTVAIRPPGEAVLEIVAADPTLLETSKRDALNFSVDDLIFKSLLADLRAAIQSGTLDGRSQFFLQLIQNGQDLLDGIPPAERAAALSDLSYLFFLQCIHAVGFEIPRLYRLEAGQRQAVVQAFEDALANFPTSAPTDPIEKLVYTYLEPVAKNRVQRDVRFRVSSFLKSMVKYQELLGSDFPRVDSGKQIVNSTQFTGIQGGGDASALILPSRAARDDLGKPRQWIVNGCPGSGKSFYVAAAVGSSESTHIVRTTFHGETSYFDFAGSYKPVPVYETGSFSITDSAGRPFTRGRPNINYEFVPGPMVHAYAQAMLNPMWNVVLIIEEMNRANCSAVFGDFFQLLDRDPPTGQSTYPIRPSSDLASYLAQLGILTESGLKLPANLYVWATMNNADQGVIPLDSAFRRRWDFEYKGHATPCRYPEADRKVRYGGKMYDWDEFRRRINSFLISEGVHEDKLVGPYFLTMLELKDPKKVLYKLYLYLWEDALRFQHKKLMNFDSFAELERAWADGAGSPLSIAFE